MKNLERCLAFDISNRWLLLGLFSHNSSYVRELSIPRSGFTLLPRLIQEIIKEASIKKPDTIACTLGPGSYTGVRLGIVYARSLGQFWDIPVIGIDSRFYYCYDLLQQKQELSHVSLLIEAKKKKVYHASLASLSNTKDFHKYHFQDLKEKGTSNIEDLIETWKEKKNIYSDAPEEIKGYLLKPHLLSILPMPQPKILHLYQLVSSLSLENLRDKFHWSQLLPEYGKPLDLRKKNHVSS